MHAVNLIALHVPEPEYPDAISDGVCCVTGARTSCLPREALIGKSFMDWDKLAAPSSPRVGLDAYRAWSYGFRHPGKKVDFFPERHSCWYVSEREFRQLSRADVRGLVLNGSADTPWAAWITTSYRKHGSLRAPVNHGPYGLWGFDELRPDCTDGGRVAGWWARLRVFQDAGIGRECMLRGSVPTSLMKKITLEACINFETWAEDKYRSSLYQFLVYLLPSKQELQDGKA